ncbi:hypothetical protein IFM89_004992 [Coptis chinensis]|uniref:Uncharacterized protein n=1 Tax=Coptis chinensis TaxID=261450 RepID=A0A835HLE8_9MAGN|nr:hypothetical protein IFM89_004992 [Coptis chinensis]
MKVIWVPPINGQGETMFPPEYTSSDPIPNHTNSFSCLNNIILFSGLDEFGNEKRPAQAILDGHFAAGSLELGLRQESSAMDWVHMEREFLVRARVCAKQWPLDKNNRTDGWRTSPINLRLFDINAPDLYIPLMPYGTYVVLAGFTLGLIGKDYLDGFAEILLLKVSLYSLGSGEAPLLDIVAYAGYAFTGMCVPIMGRIMWSYSYYFLMPFMCLCMGVFLVKTVKRIIFAEIRSYDSSKQNYALLFMA